MTAVVDAYAAPDAVADAFEEDMRDMSIVDTTDEEKGTCVGASVCVCVCVCVFVCVRVRVRVRACVFFVATCAYSCSMSIPGRRKMVQLTPALTFFKGSVEIFCQSKMWI